MPLNFAYYRRLFNVYLNYRRRRVSADTLPIRFWLELHSDCNLKCVMCPNRDLKRSDRGSMEWSVFKKVVDEIQDYAYDLALHHRGESLLHPQAVKMIGYAAERIPTTKLHTNGTLLDGKTARGLINSGLTRLSISFDGFNKRDYEKIRRGGDFDRVVENIRAFLQLRQKLKRKFPHLAIEVIELSKSQIDYEKKRSFLRELKSMGLDELVIKQPHNWAGYIKRDFSQKHYAPCTFLWNALLVLWNGDVVPCAQDFFAKNIIGNVRENRLEDIWNGKPQRNLRQGLIDMKYKDFPACSQCDRLWRETFLGIPKEYLKQIMLNKMP